MFGRLSFLLLQSLYISAQESEGKKNKNGVSVTSYEECDESVAAQCAEGTKYCEKIGNYPEYRCVCKPGFQGQHCDQFDYELKCDQSHITVKAKKKYFDDMNVPSFEDLHLNDNECGAKEEISTDRKGTKYYIWTISGSPRNCGSTVSKNATHLMYSNAIRDADNTADAHLVTRSRIEIKFHCTFPVNYRLSLNNDLKPKIKTIAFANDMGKFEVDFKLFQDSQFMNEWKPAMSDGPVEIAKGQRIHIQMALTSIVSDVASKLVVDECWGTPTNNPKAEIAYTLIQTGCPQDKTVKIFSNGNSPFVRYEFQMFGFRKIEANIHLHCVVRVCGNDCEQQCDKFNNLRRRKRRDVENEEFLIEEAIMSETEINLITSPSIRVRYPGEAGQIEGKISRDAAELENKNLPKGLSDAILIVLIVVLVMVICAIAIGVYMVIQKKRTELADQILEDSQKPKAHIGAAAGTGFSNFGYFG